MHLEHISAIIYVGTANFVNIMTFPNLPADFQIQIHIYCLFTCYTFIDLIIYTPTLQ